MGERAVSRWRSLTPQVRDIRILLEVRIAREQSATIFNTSVTLCWKPGMTDWTPFKETHTHAQAARRMTLLRTFPPGAKSLRDPKRPAALTTVRFASILNERVAPEDEIQAIHISPLNKNPYGLCGMRGSRRKARPSVIQRIFDIADKTYGTIFPAEGIAAVAAMNNFASAYVDDQERYDALDAAFSYPMQALRESPAQTAEKEVERLMRLVHFDSALATVAFRLDEDPNKLSLLMRRLVRNATDSLDAYRTAISTHAPIATPLGDLAMRHLDSNLLQLMGMDLGRAAEIDQIVRDRSYFANMSVICDLFLWSEVDARHALSIASLLCEKGFHYEDEMFDFGLRLLRSYNAVSAVRLEEGQELPRSHRLYELNVLKLFTDTYIPAQTPALRYYFETMHGEVLDQFRAINNLAA